MKKTILIALISMMAAYGCYSETNGTLHGDATLDTSPDSESGEICDNGVDDDGDGLVDCRDLDCASECPDAPADVTPDGDEDTTPPGEICDNGVDDDGDGFVDCRDSDCPPCSDASTDAPEDVEPDVSEDPIPDPEPEPDAEADVEDEEVTTCLPTPGEVTLTWTLSGHVYDDLRAECWVSGPADDWHSGWEDIIDWSAVPTAGLCTNGSDDDGDLLIDCRDGDGSEDCTNEPSCFADAWATSTFTISYTLSYAPAMEAWCNFTAFDVVSGVITNQKYAVGMWISGTYDEHGTLTATSGSCDVTSDVTVEYAGFGTACNYHITLP